MPNLAQHFARLGLRPPASRLEVANAYRAAALRVHPDRGGNAAEFALLRDSYEKVLAAADGTRRVYAPSSTNVYGANSHGKKYENEHIRVMATIFVPAAIASAVSVSLICGQPEREDLRAGGTSRFRPPRPNSAPQAVVKDSAKILKEEKRTGNR